MEKPTEPRQFYFDCKFHKLYANADGIAALLAMKPGKEASGDKDFDRVGGSDICRIALWQWVFTRIEPRRCRLPNEIGERLGTIMDFEKGNKRPIKLVPRARFCCSGKASV